MKNITKKNKGKNRFSEFNICTFTIFHLNSFIIVDYYIFKLKNLIAIKNGFCTFEIISLINQCYISFELNRNYNSIFKKDF